jgi:acyl-CoA dehydrogenase
MTPIAKAAGWASRCRRIWRAGPALHRAPAVGEYLSSANMALMMYPGLTRAPSRRSSTHGSEEQKATYLPKMVSGVWTGTMNLTEPHCGTDLGLLRTKAVPNGDGLQDFRPEDLHLGRRARHGGEHHPSGAGPHRGRAGRHKGISLFIVPKFLLDEPTAIPASATAFPAAPSKRRWASTATRPAS